MKINKSRRNAIAKTIKGIGGLAFGGFLWSIYLSKMNASRFHIRPPGALEEDKFIQLCIKCGLCVEACPFDTLKLAKLEDNALIGTPYFTPRDIPCYMCVDIPCIIACPTKALDDKTLINNNNKNINNAKMGIAIVDNNSCIAYFGIQCDACYRACPLIDIAIKLEYKKNHNTNKHAYLLPVVDNSKCTGCGICEKVCVTSKAAITILPKDKVLGKTSNSYIKVWDNNTKNNLHIQNNSLDYLNGDF